jgi:hypothetical protein
MFMVAVVVYYSRYTVYGRCTMDSQDVVVDYSRYIDIESLPGHGSRL